MININYKTSKLHVLQIWNENMLLCNSIHKAMCEGAKYQYKANMDRSINATKCPTYLHLLSDTAHCTLWFSVITSYNSSIDIALTTYTCDNSSTTTDRMLWRTDCIESTKYFTSYTIDRHTPRVLCTMWQTYSPTNDNNVSYVIRMRVPFWQNMWSLIMVIKYWPNLTKLQSNDWRTHHHLQNAWTNRKHDNHPIPTITEGGQMCRCQCTVHERPKYLATDVQQRC